VRTKHLKCPIELLIVKLREAIAEMLPDI
jgi:hypothetical protein